MKVGLNVEGHKHHFYKVFNHNLRGYFLKTYINVLDLMSASTCERSITSKTLNLLNIFKFRFLSDCL
jgi:hypothetical protein